MKLERLVNTAAAAALPAALFAATRPANVSAEYTGERRFKGNVFNRGTFGHLVRYKGRFRDQLLRGGETFVGRIGNQAIRILDAEQGFDDNGNLVEHGHAVVQLGVDVIKKVHKRGRKRGKVYFKMRGGDEPVVLEHGETKEVFKGLKLTYMDPRRRRS
jgi:hypothetical protein